MKRALFAAPLATLLIGCAAFQSALPYLPPPRDELCAADEIEKGDYDPIKIVQACPGLAVVAASDLEALIVHLLAAHHAQHAAAMRAGAAKLLDGAAHDADAGASKPKDVTVYIVVTPTVDGGTAK